MPLSCSKCGENGLRLWPLSPLGILGFLLRPRGGSSQLPARSVRSVLFRCPICGHRGMLTSRSEF